MQNMRSRLTVLDKMMIEKWRELGFYYDCDDRLSVNQWRFYGSKVGLHNIVSILDQYISDPTNETLSEHEHYGPYFNLKIMTWDKPTITHDYIAGTIEDLAKLKSIIFNKLSESQPGQTFSIDKDYGSDNSLTTKIFVMADNFDPASMDELVYSGRQEIVNNSTRQR